MNSEPSDRHKPYRSVLKRAKFIWPFFIGVAPWILGGVLLGVSFLCPSTVYSAFLGWSFSLFFATLYLIDERPAYCKLFSFGLAAHITTFHWLAKVISVFGEFSGFSSAILLILFSAVSSFQFVAMNAVYRGLRRNAFLLRYQLCLPCAWLLAEITVPKLVPWMLGHTQIRFSLLAQFADVAGVSLISWVMLWCSSCLVFLIRSLLLNQRQAINIGSTLAAAISFSLILVYGYIRIQQVNAAVNASPSISLLVIQGNLDPLRDFHANKKDINIEKYRQLSISYMRDKDVDLLIWPESSVGHDYFGSDEIINKGSSRDPFPERTMPIIFGGQTRVLKYRDGKDAYYNSAYLLGTNGAIKGVYHKNILFPFSERMPLSDLFPVLENLHQKKFIMLSGGESKPLEIRLTASSGELVDLKIATIICYEDMWTKPFRDMVSKEGANLLLVLSNDNWFLQSVASQQHHLVASWRAIENRRYLVRATNNGITAVINPLGETIHSLPPFLHSGLYESNIHVVDIKSPFHFISLLF